MNDFLAVGPERLAITVREHGSEPNVPVAVSPDFRMRLTDLLQPSTREDTTAAGKVDLRSAFDLARVGGDMDPRVVGHWIVENGEPFLDALRGVYARALEEVGRVEGGEETAYLSHLALVKTVSDALVGQPAAWLAVTSVLMEGTFEEFVSARLGLQFALTTSPLMLGTSRKELLAASVNLYQTTPQVLEKVEAPAYDPLEAAADESFIRNVSISVLEDDAARISVSQAFFCEQVRDQILQVVMAVFNHEDAATEHLENLRNLASSTASMEEYLFNSWQREELNLWLSMLPSGGPLDEVRALVEYADAAAHGEIEGLPERVEHAAAGGLLLLLDEYVQSSSKSVYSRLRWVSPDEQQSMYQAGRCYWIGNEDRPLYQLPERHTEAYLFVNTRAFAHQTGQIKERALGDFLRRVVYEPILAAAAKHPGALEVSQVTGDGVALCGEIGAVVGLANEVREVLKSAWSELRNGADGSPLEAGLYIAFGDAPVSLDVSNDELGTFRVSIADALDEGARGTAVSPALRASRAERVNKASEETGAQLLVPFLVLAEGTQLYNVGCALSGEALLAFRSVLEGTFTFEETAIAAGDARGDWFFDRDPERFLVARAIGETVIHVFRFAGNVSFKGGQDAPVDVWELLPIDSPFRTELL